MANNTGFLMLAGLGVLLFLGRGARSAAPEIVEDAGYTTIEPETGISAASDDTSTLEIDPAVVQLGSGEIITVTEQVVRRSEQIKKQIFDQNAGVLPGPVSVPVPIPQGDIEAIQIAEETFDYGGAPRPTATAMPVWNNRYGWYWVDPPSGRAVGSGGKLWSPGDTSMHRGAPSVNIGPTLPPGWVPNRGGSADFVGITEHDYSLA